MPTLELAALALLEALPDVVVVADDQGCIVYANRAVHSLLGHEPEGLRGQPLTVLIPERFRSAHSAGFARFLVAGPGGLFGTTAQLPAQHGNGSEVAVELTLSRISGDHSGTAGGVVIGVLRDASATVRLERQLEVGRYLAATLRVTTALTQAPDADAAFGLLLPTLCAELDWDAATLWQPQGPAGPLEHTGTWTPPGAAVPAMEAVTRGRVFARGEGLPGLAWQRRGPVVAEDLWEEPNLVRTDAVRADTLHTAVVFPILRGDTLLGVCELFSREQRPVPGELVEVLASAGRQIGQFLARLTAESEVRALADTLQRSLLPSHLPVVPGIQLAARYRPGGGSALVGGDTYDLMPLPGGRWMVLIADVCGTGAEAAAVTALTRHTARAAASTGSPSEVLCAVNTALLQQQTGPLRFVTACCLVLETHRAGHRVSVGVAGHPLPMLRTADGGTVETGTAGLPLGIDPDVQYTETTVDLPPGATLVLYTDGVTEARDDAGHQFGEDGLAAVLSGLGTGDAECAVAAVTAAVEEQLSGSRYEADDLAVLALAVPPASSVVRTTIGLTGSAGCASNRQSPVQSSTS